MKVLHSHCSMEGQQPMYSCSTLTLVDDGTGVLSCTQWREQEDSDRGLYIPSLGQLVAVWGKLSEYKEVRQLTVTTIAEQRDPNAEPLHWLEVIHLKRTVYSSPFSPPLELTARSLATGSLKATIKESVLNFLDNFYLGKYFTLPELSASTDLAKHCRESVTSDAVTEEAVMQEIKTVVQELAEMGAIIPAIGVGRHKETKYEVSLIQLQCKK